MAISVEGPTEREFVQKVLAPYLHRHSAALSVTPVCRHGKISLSLLKDDLPSLVRSFDYVTTLYDYYGFPESRSGRMTIDQLEAALHELVGGASNFLPYLQRHEFEALIFSAPDIVADALNTPEQAAGLARIVRECGTPEDIDHGFDTCPSRRLKKLFPGYEKVLHGPPIAAEIGIDRIRASCPRFARWLDRLEARVAAR